MGDDDGHPGSSASAAAKQRVERMLGIVLGLVCLKKGLRPGNAGAMQSRFHPGEQARFVESLGPGVPPDLARRVHTSRLLGAEPALVLHGGGNTSAKGTARDVFGDEVEVLWVKGSGSDLAAIGPLGFPACRLAPLRRLCELSQLSDEAMVRELRASMLDPSSPTPSVEALLHALLPAKFVDHTHADAVLSLVDTPDSERLVRDVFGGEALFLPYVMPGFVLARAVRDLLKREGEARHGAPLPSVLVLDKHGIFTWGDTAEASYERMIEAVTRVEQYLEAKLGPWPTVASSEGATPSTALAAAARALPTLRGALAERSGRNWVLTLRASERILSEVARSHAERVLTSGTATPDHVIRTKPWPLVLPADFAHLDDADRLATARAALGAYEAHYATYFDRWSHAELKRLDPHPRVMVLPGVGLVAAGANAKETRVALDLAEHTLDVAFRAEALGGYQPASERDLFDLEYWSLEQAKLGKPSGPARWLDGRVALVTGAASGLGLATAKAFLAGGAHVMVTDRPSGDLAAAKRELAAFGTAVSFAECDVLSDQSVEQAMERACAVFGGLDVVVSNAGGAFQGRIDTPAGDDALHRSLELNFWSHQRVARAAAAVLSRQGRGGALLFNASKSAFNQGPDFGPYAVPKAALVALVRQYAVDLAPFGIRASAVNADRIRTGIFDEALLTARAKARGTTVDAYFRTNLLGRETLASDVADAFVYLASAEATTGCVVTVDGGNAAAFVR
jgi:rhamnose utilization protein RhaD (predicted bifunctional aldolase and dehydrogenase)/NAD(P)-dependent dehydrogenase (short-subunit alcohol dehydrogenase family)